MSAASWLIERVFLLCGTAKGLPPRKFYKKLRKGAIRFRKGERIRALFLGVKVEEGVYCGMRYYSFIPKEIDTSKSVMYLHGSAYMNAHRLSQERFAAELAEKTHAKVYFPIYPKLPKQSALPCIAVLNNFCSFLLRKGGEIILVGDGSGGALCLALAAERSDLRRVIAISPWLILPPCEEAMVAERDAVLSSDMLKQVADLWGCGLPANNVKVSPFYGRYAGKEILLFAGECERFYHEIIRFAAEKGEECAWIDRMIGIGQQHGYPLMPTPEGRAARLAIRRRLEQWLYGGTGE